MEKFTSSAKVIDGTLILTLPDAITPVVWQMQLGQTKSSALEVREQNGNWILFLKTPRMDVMQIAPFETKDAAVKALLAVSRAMEKAHGQIAPGGSANYPVPAVISAHCGRFSWICRVFKVLLYIFLTLLALGILAIGFLWIVNAGSGASAPETAPSAATEQAPLAGDAPAGEPVSADDFLNNQ